MMNLRKNSDNRLKKFLYVIGSNFIEIYPDLN